VVPVQAAGSSRTLAAVSAVAAVALASTLVLAFVHFRETPATDAAVRFEIPPPGNSRFNSNAAVSPDGRQLAFSAPGPDGVAMLWLRALDSPSSRPLAGTSGVAPPLAPFWSPDSRFLAYGGGSDGPLRKVDVTGGAPVTLAAYPGAFRHGTWSPVGFILYGSQRAGLMRVSDAGGTPTPVTRIENARGEQHSEPAFLPDGRRFLYLKRS
jgi:WD40 repeat protein